MVAMPGGGVKNLVSMVKDGAANAGKAQPSATISAKPRNNFFMAEMPPRS